MGDFNFTLILYLHLFPKGQGKSAGLLQEEENDLQVTFSYCTWTDYKTNTQITKELKITPILDKLLEHKRNWMQHVNTSRMPRNRLPRVMKPCSPTGRRNHGRPLKRFLDTRDRNGSTNGATPWQMYDYYYYYFHIVYVPVSFINESTRMRLARHFKCKGTMYMISFGRNTWSKLEIIWKAKA